MRLQQRCCSCCWAFYSGPPDIPADPQPCGQGSLVVTGPTIVLGQVDGRHSGRQRAGQAQLPQVSALATFVAIFLLMCTSVIL